MKLILMRGVSGSGKSTLAKEIASRHEGAVILSTDDFFMVEGEYVFDPKKISLNHGKNQERARSAMRDGTPCVIIDNTNTQSWEMKPYVLAAVEYGYQVEIHEPDPVSIEEIMRRQAQRVDSNKSLSLEIVERMLARYERDVTVENILKS